MFEWKESYSVGIRSIDGQHQNLFRLAARLYDAINSGNSKAILANLLDSLVHYTHVHFQQEERLMQAAEYPNFAAHKAQHEALLSQVRKFQEDYEKGQIAMSVTVLQFLKNWLEKHIMQSDQEYAPYVKAKTAA